MAEGDDVIQVADAMPEDDDIETRVFVGHVDREVAKKVSEIWAVDPHVVCVLNMCSFDEEGLTCLENCGSLLVSNGAYEPKGPHMRLLTQKKLMIGYDQLGVDSSMCLDRAERNAQIRTVISYAMKHNTHLECLSIVSHSPGISLPRHVFGEETISDSAKTALKTLCLKGIMVSGVDNRHTTSSIDDALKCFPNLETLHLDPDIVDIPPTAHFAKSATRIETIYLNIRKRVSSVWASDILTRISPNRQLKRIIVTGEEDDSCMLINTLASVALAQPHLKHIHIDPQLLDRADEISQERFVRAVTSRGSLRKVPYILEGTPKEKLALSWVASSATTEFPCDPELSKKVKSQIHANRVYLWSGRHNIYNRTRVYRVDDETVTPYIAILAGPRDTRDGQIRIAPEGSYPSGQSFMEDESHLYIG